MNGDYNRFVPVPTTDLHFWYYFNETCFVECDSFQRRKKMDEQDRVNKMLLKSENEFNIPKPEPEIKSEIVTEPEQIVQIKEPELKKETEEEMPLEENKDFIKQKREHPVYPKREYIKPEPKADTEPEKDKKTKKTKKGKNDEQQSLF